MPQSVSKGKAQTVFRTLGLVSGGILFLELLFTVYAFSEGYLTPRKLAVFVKVMKGEPIAARSPASQGAGLLGRAGTSVELADAIQDAQESLDKKQDQVRREMENLRQLKADLERFRRELAEERANVEAVRRQFEDRFGEYVARTTSKGFQEAVRLYEKMDAADAAALLLAKPEKDLNAMVELIRAFRPSFAADVLTEMKRAEEQSGPGPDGPRVAAIMDRIRNGQPVASRPVR